MLHTEDMKETIQLITMEQQFLSFLDSGPSQKITEDPKELIYLWVYLSVFIVLEVKTRKLKKILFI